MNIKKKLKNFGNKDLLFIEKKKKKNYKNKFWNKKLLDKNNLSFNKLFLYNKEKNRLLKDVAPSYDGFMPKFVFKT